MTHICDDTCRYGHWDGSSYYEKEMILWNNQRNLDVLDMVEPDSYDHHVDLPETYALDVVKETEPTHVDTGPRRKRRSGRR